MLRVWGALHPKYFRLCIFSLKLDARIKGPRASLLLMDNVFKDAMIQIHKPAAPELTRGFKEQLLFIKLRFKHTSTTVTSCLAGLGESPTLLELLAAAFVVNGGILFKYSLDSDGSDSDIQPDGDLSSFIKEIEGISPFEED